MYKKNIFNTFFILIFAYIFILNINDVIFNKSIYNNNFNDLKVDINDNTINKYVREIYEKYSTVNINLLKKINDNDDIIGFLYIPNTKINEIIVASIDNEFYLSHGINKQKNKTGNIFIDYRVNIYSRQINIYGHNSNIYDVPFQDLEGYLDYNFYLDHLYVYIVSNDVIYEYKVFSVQITDNSEHMNIFSNNQNHLNELSNSIYETEDNIALNDNILVLQTCSNTYKNKLLLVNSKLVYTYTLKSVNLN